MPLDKELQTYQRELRTLLASAGKYVVIHGKDVAGVYDTYHDAIKIGYERFGLDPFLVKQITAVERTHHFTRQLSPCPT